jgi:hypothetical protein
MCVIVVEHSSIGVLAEQLAFAAPLDPLQVQVRGPFPDTAEAVPALQRLVVGFVVMVVLLADPQTPVITQLPFS